MLWRGGKPHSHHSKSNSNAQPIGTKTPLNWGVLLSGDIGDTQNRDEPYIRYQYKTELLDAMEKIAPFTEWRGELDEV